MTNPTLQDAPDATADRGTLLAWYRDVVQTFAACHHYEAFRGLCYWCLGEEQQFRARGARRDDTVKYCSTRCVDAADAYRTKVLHGGKTPALDAENEAGDVA
jgi:hypothetical protein